MKKEDTFKIEIGADLTYRNIYVFEEYSFDLIDVVAQGCEVVGNIYENSELLK